MNARGFTLLELLLVIVITGILAVVVAPVINEPIRAYFDQGGRAALVDAAEMAMRRMERDVRRALPYSLRNPDSQRFDFVHVRDVARYRQNGGPQSRRLRFNAADDEFNLVGRFPSITAPYALSGRERLVIFNLGSSPYDIYAGDAVVTPSGTSVTISDDGDEHHVTLAPAHQFQDSSPSHRVYLVDGPVSYACNGGGLYRYTNYDYDDPQPTAAAVAAGELLADKVSSCAFSYHPGSSTQPGLLMMTLTLSSDDGESVTLQHMVHVPNSI